MDEERKLSSLKDIISLNGERYAIRTAFLLKNESGEIYRVSYKKFAAHINRLGTALKETLGLKGQKIAVCGKNCYEWCVSYLAVCGGGGVVVPLDRETIAEELVNIINFAKIGAVIADNKAAQRLLEHYESLPKNFHIICFDSLDDERVIGYNTLTDSGKRLIESGCLSYINAEIDPDKAAVILFTSGTTGTAKGVMLSNRNICSDIEGTLGTVEICKDDSTMCVLPLHHAYQAIVTLLILCVGGCVSFCENLRRLTENLNEYRPTVFVTVPLLLEKIHAKIISALESQRGLKKAFAVGKARTVLSRLAGSETKRLLFSKVHAVFGGKLRLIIGGGAMFSPDIARDFEAFGLPVVIGYGLTECSPIAICNSPKDPRPDGIGKPIGGAEAKINNPASDGIGEILIKGPMVMLGYYEAPEETAKVIKDGWFYTGDLGYADSEGNYHITGRSKNVIVTKNGKNIYPEELEYYLNNDPLVLESLISGDSTGEDGEQVAAQVVPDEEAIKHHLQKEKLSKEDIQKAIIGVVRKINKKLPSYKSIKKVSVRDGEFDKTATHKVKRGSALNKRKKEHEKTVEKDEED